MPAKVIDGAVRDGFCVGSPKTSGFFDALVFSSLRKTPTQKSCCFLQFSKLLLSSQQFGSVFCPSSLWGVCDVKTANHCF